MELNEWTSLTTLYACDESVDAQTHIRIIIMLFIT